MPTTTERPMTKKTRVEAMIQRVKDDKEFAVGCLMRLYSFQTVNEKATEQTVEQNDMGFNACDAEFLSSMAEQYQRKGWLSDRQLAFAQKKLQKYVRNQLIQLKVEPLPIRPPAVTMKKKEDQQPKKPTVVMLDNNTLKLLFTYNAKRVEEVRGLEGRRFNGTKKFWTCPKTVDNVAQLMDWKFIIPPEVTEWYERATTPPEKLGDIEVPGLKHELFGFQKEGVGFIEQRMGRALIGDEMGLGKTIQAIGWLQLNPKARPAVIVVPATVKLNWKRELEKWMPKPKVAVLSGKAPMPVPGEIFIINYDILEAWMPYFKEMKPRTMILDECHYVKNQKAKRTKAVMALGKMAAHVIALSGTPIVNRPIEMYTALRMIEPAMFPSFWKYAQRYCGAKHNGFGWNFNGASNTEELHDKLKKSIMLRRLKKDVLKDLPPKVRTVIPLDIINREEYDNAEADFIGWLEGQDVEDGAVESAKRAEALSKIEKLKQLTVQGKLVSCVNWIEDFIDSGEKLVVFCVHRKIVETLMTKFADVAVKVDGSVTGNMRQEAVDRFQNEEGVRLFVGNIKAAGVGITLTAASNTCFIELGWTPGDHDQAEDRVHRIGQESNSVGAYYLLAEGTIEETIAELIDKKRKVLTRVLDGEEAEGDSMLKELFSSFRKDSL